MATSLFLFLSRRVCAGSIYTALARAARRSRVVIEVSARDVDVKDQDMDQDGLFVLRLENKAGRTRKEYGMCVGLALGARSVPLVQAFRSVAVLLLLVLATVGADW